MEEVGTERRTYLGGGAQVHEAILRVQLRDGELGRQGLGGRRVEDLVDVFGQRVRGRHVESTFAFALSKRWGRAPSFGCVGYKVSAVVAGLRGGPCGTRSTYCVG